MVMRSLLLEHSLLGVIQLADFVKIPLQKSGGMLAMVDTYCLFNRARGTGQSTKN